MKSFLRAIALCCFLGSFTRIADASQHTNCSTAVFYAISPDRALSAREPAPSPTPQKLDANRQAQAAQRLDVSSKTIAVKDRLTIQTNVVVLPADPPFNDFTRRGVYHRYRPRDPTT